MIHVELEWSDHKWKFIARECMLSSGSVCTVIWRAVEEAKGSRTLLNSEIPNNFTLNSHLKNLHFGSGAFQCDSGQSVVIIDSQKAYKRCDDSVRL